MDFIEFIKEFDRMCLHYMRMSDKCKSCPMECSNISQCRKEAFERPEHVESIVKSWSEKNPTKYPSWFEYLNEKGMVRIYEIWEPDKCAAFLAVDEFFKPIPDHIALSLDLKKR